MYGDGKLNGVPFFTQPGGPGTQVFPALPQGAPFPDWPGAGSMVFSYGPWVMPGCLHPIKQFRVAQDFDYNTNQLVALLLCPCCQYLQRVIYTQSEYGPTGAFDPNLYAVIVC
jgi:hypothetical protein